jgi:hypothetical protein
VTEWRSTDDMDEITAPWLHALGDIVPRDAQIARTWQAAQDAQK